MLEARMEGILRAAPTLMRVLRIIRDLELPDGLVMSGAVYQPVWNHVTGRDPEYGLKDFDVGYFDPDISYDAEDAVIRRVAAACPAELRDLVEVRNQARVHVWFEKHFGRPYESYTPLTHSAEALERFTATAFAVGVRLSGDRLRIDAPFGLDDLFAMRLRPNPIRATTGFEGTAAAARARWPEATIVPASPVS
ncbi:MAG TPA: nucleotidyltransferase family protein [Jatrophihabitantaceae bacterium]|nr:nucleotidyltransferase family protein [Jatrophihabitantaceae bacterium]